MSQVSPLHHESHGTLWRAALWGGRVTVWSDSGSVRVVRRVQREHPRPFWWTTASWRLVELVRHCLSVFAGRSFWESGWYKKSKKKAWRNGFWWKPATATIWAHASKLWRKICQMWGNQMLAASPIARAWASPKVKNVDSDCWFWHVYFSSNLKTWKIILTLREKNR